jgi:hypothetical protein
MLDVRCSVKDRNWIEEISAVLLVTQFPLGDARVLASGVTGRVSKPDWGNVDAYGGAFVRYFGRVIDRRTVADPAWIDERYFCRARHAIGLTDLAGSRSIEAAFRHLLVDETKVVARIEVGLRIKHEPKDAGKGYVEIASEVGHMKTRVPESSGQGSTKQLLSQRNRLARLYEFATTRSGVNTEVKGLVGAGLPMMLIEVDDDAEFKPPPGARVLDPAKVGGCDLAFTRFGSNEWLAPLWIVRRGKDHALARSLRASLLRLHAEKEAILVVTRLMDRGWLVYEPRTPAGERLTQWLQKAKERLQKKTYEGISQTAIMEAIEAAESVTYPDDSQGLARSLEGAQRQIAANLAQFTRELEATRAIQDYWHVEEGGKVVKDSIVIKGSTVTGSNIVRAERMRDAVANFQQAPVSEERKQAVDELAKVATALIEQLDDEAKKDEIAEGVELIAKQAEKEEPGANYVRAAGETIVKIGNGVQEFAEPIAKAVNKVLSVLKLAPLLL